MIFFLVKIFRNVVYRGYGRRPAAHASRAWYPPAFGFGFGTAGVSAQELCSVVSMKQFGVSGGFPNSAL